MTNTGRGFLDFAGRSVVVTGASSGLGRACAEELAHHGARVVLIGRNVERLGEVRAGLVGDGHEVLVLSSMNSIALDRRSRAYRASSVASMGSVTPRASWTRGLSA